MAGLIVLGPLSARGRKNLDQFIAQAGDLYIYGTSYRRRQLLEVKDILEGRSFIIRSVVGKTESQPVLPMDKIRACPSI